VFHRQQGHPFSILNRLRLATRQEKLMKILIASVGVPGHLNPLLAAGSILSKHHEIAVQVSKEFRPAVEKAGLRYLPEIPGNSTSGRDFSAKHAEFLDRTRGPDRIAFMMQHFFAKNIPIQAANLQHALAEFPADLILADSTFFGTLPLLLGSRENRPAIAHLGITVLNVHSGTYLPLRLDATREAASSEQDRHSRIVLQPVQAAFDRVLREMDLGPLPHPALESLSRLADFYIHPGVRSFAFPDDSADVHYIGRLPMAKGQVAMPPWWASLDRSKRLVLVTQGTVANRDFTRLIGPALTGLASQDDVTLLVTTGGQPASSIPVDIPENAFVAEFLPFEVSGNGII
jgi:hypothetical protein